MKLTPKQVGGIAVLAVALIVSYFFNPQDEETRRNSSRSEYSRDSGSRPANQFRPSQGTRVASKRTRNEAGQFDYYSLVLSWSPTYCATRTSNRRDRQCDYNKGRGYAFVLHGLWPQYTRGYPESCWTKQKPFVPRRTIDSMLDIMPSPGLVIHEYKKHGTCSGLSPDRYYELSRQLYSSIKIPKRYMQPANRQTVSPQQLVREFVTINPGLSADMMAVSCRGAGNRLREVRICFSKDGILQSCGGNERKGRLCSAKRMFVPPVRASGR